MRPAAFTTIAFLAGQHGFGIFVPYLGVFLVVACALRTRRQRRAASDADAIPVSSAGALSAAAAR